MSDLIREQSKWAREKTKIVVPYLKDVDGVLSVVAGRGFSSAPGYLYEAQMLRELELKWKLSDINFEILSDSIERELKQQGITYDLAFKTALMAWELEKQNLLYLWEVEYSIIRQNMAHSEEALISYILALKDREILYIGSKYAIDLAAEGYRTQIALLDGQTGDLEVEFAEKKLLTAQRKLELLPIIATLISKQQELIVREGGKIAEENLLMMALNNVLAKKSTVLVPAITSLMAAMNALLIDLKDQKIQLDLLATAKEDYATEKLDTMDWKLKTANVQADIEGLEQDVQMLKLGMETARAKYDSDMSTKESDHKLLVSTQMTTDLDEIKIDYERTMNNVKNDKTTNATKDTINRKDVERRLNAADIDVMNNTAYWQNWRVQETANVNAVTDVTATLSHLLSM